MSVEVPVGLQPVELPMGLQPGVGSRAWMAFSNHDELARTASFVMPPVPPGNGRLASPDDVKVQKAAYHAGLEQTAKQHTERARLRHQQELNRLKEAVESQRSAMEVQMQQRVAQLNAELAQQLLSIEGSHHANRITLEQQASEAVQKFNTTKGQVEEQQQLYTLRKQEFDEHMQWCVEKAQAPLTPAPALYSPGGPPAAGDVVEGFWEDGRWYPAKVEMVNVDGTYKVIWLDDGSWTCLPPSQIRRAGSHVIVPGPLPPSPTSFVCPPPVQPAMLPLTARCSSPLATARYHAGAYSPISPLLPRAASADRSVYRTPSPAQSPVGATHFNVWPAGARVEPSTIDYSHSGIHAQQQGMLYPSPAVSHSGPPTRGSIGNGNMHAAPPTYSYLAPPTTQIMASYHMEPTTLPASHLPPPMEPTMMTANHMQHGLPPPPVVASAPTATYMSAHMEPTTLHAPMEPVATLPAVGGCCTPRMTQMEPMAYGAAIGSRPLTREELLSSGALYPCDLPKPAGPSPLDRDF